MDMENIKVSKFGTLLIETTKKFKILVTDDIHVRLLQHCLQSSTYYITNDRHVKSALWVPQQVVLK